MVLENVMKTFSFLFAISMIVACDPSILKAESEDNIVKFQIAENQYSIGLNKPGNCTITNDKNGNVTELELKAPCTILKSFGKVQTKFYPKHGTLFFIVGPPAPMSDFANDSWVKEEYRCSKSDQQILMLKDGDLVKRPVKNVTYICPDIGLDDKDFYVDEFHK
jgi:hypothetical protein